MVLYSTGCPVCKILEKKLNEKGINYETNTNVDYMLTLGITSVPVLEVNGNLLKAKEAMEWIDNVN